MDLPVLTQSGGQEELTPAGTRTPKLIVLPGDGIGPEVVRETVRVVEWFAANRGFDCNIMHEEFGVACWQRTGHLLREEIFAEMMEADAVLFGATGAASGKNPVPQDVRRREGLLRIRRDMDLFANLRPVKTISVLADASTLRPNVIEGVNMVIVRELIGGIYFGEPRGIERMSSGGRRGVNTQVYTTPEIHRIGKVAFELAGRRGKHVTSVDKANVMESGLLWREEMISLHQQAYQGIRLDHLFVDNASMQIIRAPRQFDVLVTDNLFGDILSDCAAMIAGSLGMLPSASLSEPAANGRRRALYEPVHGSAPDIAGQGKANPLAAILSFAMALEMSFERRADARLLEDAVALTVVGKRTPDIAGSGAEVVSTSGMGDAVLATLDRLGR